MNIEHLRYVLEVDRAGSISQAAENLFMGQPNLSKAIKELESSLNISIFRRTSKGTEITPKGREFLRYAQLLLQQYEEIKALGRDENDIMQNLRVTIPRASYIVDAFTTFLSNLDTSKPIKIDFSEASALRAIRHVTSKRSEIGIIRCKTEYKNYFTSLLRDSDLDWRILLESEYRLLISHQNPLSKKDLIEEGDLHDLIEIIHGDTAISYAAGSVSETERNITPGDKKVRVYERGSQFDILSRVPSTYMWVSPIPEDLLKRNGLIQIPCARGTHFTDLVIYLKNRKFSPQATSFLSVLTKSAQNISEMK